MLHGLVERGDVSSINRSGVEVDLHPSPILCNRCFSSSVSTRSPIISGIDKVTPKLERTDWKILLAT